MAAKRSSNIDPFKINHGKQFDNERDLEPVILEMTIAENNLDVIWETAQEMIRSSLLFHDLEDPSSMIRPLRDLISKIKIVFSFIRRDMKLRYPRLNVGPGQVAHAAHQKPVIEPNSFIEQKTLCPLVLFFRIISQGLRAYRINVRENSWGPIRPLHDLLLRLQDRIQSHNPGGALFWPGLSSCIMFHEYDSTFTIASSTPQYRHLQGLSSVAKTVRGDHFTHLMGQVNNRDKQKIDNVKRLCKKVAKDRTQNDFGESANRAQVDGIGATFNPSGSYMPACFLDFWRFNMPRPTRAHAIEAEVRQTDRLVYGVDSCAEWELWIIGMSKLEIMPGVELRKHPLIKTRGTFPPRDQVANPPPRYRKSSS